jgi:hypothetical protein
METIYKNPAFEEECEWRLVYTPIIIIEGQMPQETLKVEGELSSIRFRIVANSAIMPYFTYPLSDLGKHRFEIFLGPKNLTPDINFIKMYCINNGISSYLVYQSKASYR